jgi:hypothetical protein
MLDTMSVETIHFIASKLDTRGFDALRGSSRLFRASLDPFDVMLHENPIATLVSKIALGGWAACKRRLVFSSFEVESSCEYTRECFELCMYKDAGVPLHDIHAKFRGGHLPRVLRSFLIQCATFDASHRPRVARFVESLTTTQLFAALHLIWEMHT